MSVIPSSCARYQNLTVNPLIQAPLIMHKDKHVQRHAHRTHYAPPAGKLSSRSLHHRFPSVIAQVHNQIETIRRPRGPAVLRTVQNHLEAFGHDPDAFLAATSLTASASTLSSYTSAVKRIFSASGRDFKEYARFARLRKLTVEGKPKPAEVLSPAQLHQLTTQLAPEIANWVKVMILTAGRAVDLQHMHASLVEDLWKVEFLCRLDDVVGLVPPKSDREATRRIIKWLPQGDFDPTTVRAARWHVVNKAIQGLFPFATAHSIRGSVIKLLEHEGYETTEIALVSGHAPRNVPGATSYLQHLPRDRGTLKEIELVRVVADRTGIRLN